MRSIIVAKERRASLIDQALVRLRKADQAAEQASLRKKARIDQLDTRQHELRQLWTERSLVSCYCKRIEEEKGLLYSTACSIETSVFTTVFVKVISSCRFRPEYRIYSS
jgi:hypothetical protein